jgi:H+-translocating NAD(P) transhydrogenase
VYGRLFNGQMTAAGKLPPAKLLVLGAGVAGLAAIGAAKSMGALVSAYDVRAAAAEQVESMGAKFLRVQNFVEDGSGAGGYAKEMSDSYKLQEQMQLMDWVASADIVITTALIPGRPAPKLITHEMISRMKQGSVILDMAASADGGNVAISEVDKVVTSENGVKVIGYSNLPSRLASAASGLFGNNVAKFILSAGPTTKPSAKGSFFPDYDDPAVRGMLVVDRGESRWPNDRPYQQPAVKQPPLPPVVSAEEVEDAAKQPYVTSALQFSAISLGLFAFGSTTGSDQSTALLTVFLLSSYAGQQAIWGVVPALHSPLMSVTNAISGTTALGAVALLGNSVVPSTTAECLGSIALFLSVINIVGGFKISTKMLNLFKKKEDPKEYFELYIIPVAVAAGLVSFGSLQVNPGITSSQTWV